MERLVREDDKGLFILVTGWVLRPSTSTIAARGDIVRVLGGIDPVKLNFGLISFPSGHQEKWRIFNSEFK